MPATNAVLNQDWAAPARCAYAVTPHNTNDFTYVFRSLYVGTGGDVVVVTLGNDLVASSAVTFTAVPSGTILPVCGVRVNATGTTASNIVAIF